MYTIFAIVVVTFGGLIWSSLWVWDWYNKEPVIPYDIEAPTRPTERKILDNPSIKVCHQHKPFRKDVTNCFAG